MKPKMHWKDISSHSKSSKDRTPKTWQTSIAGIRLVITRHRDYDPDDWIVRSHPELLDSELLESKDVDAAKAEAESRLVACCRNVIDVYELSTQPSPK